MENEHIERPWKHEEETKTIRSIISLLWGYSKWIGKTSQERELINAIRLTIKYLEQTKGKVT